MTVGSKPKPSKQVSVNMVSASIGNTSSSSSDDQTGATVPPTVPPRQKKKKKAKSSSKNPAQLTVSVITANAATPAQSASQLTGQSME